MNREAATSAGTEGRPPSVVDSSKETLADLLARIRRDNTSINAFTELFEQRATAASADLQKRRVEGGALGPLAGVCFAVKNMFDVANVRTLAGSKINRTYPPAARDGILVRKLEAADAILIGTLNMGEYAYDFTGENPHYGPSRNPHAVGHMSGGSSGGSAAAVAAGFVPLALGSDTNGSIRLPSAFCGIFGLKPTFGRLPRSGSFPFVNSLDHVGPMARSVSLLALAYDMMQGADGDDQVVCDRGIEPSFPTLAAGIDGLRIAVAGGYFSRNAEPAALQAVGRVAKALDARKTVEIPEAQRARSAAQIITAAEGAALHLERLRSHPAAFDPIVRDRLLAGVTVPAAWVIRAQRFRRWYQSQLQRIFETVDVIIAPTTPFRAPKIGQQSIVIGGVEMPLRPVLGIFTQPISLVGLPVVAVPCWIDGELPLGVQIITAPWREDVGLRVAYHLEQSGVAQYRAPRAPSAA